MHACGEFEVDVYSFIVADTNEMSSILHQSRCRYWGKGRILPSLHLRGSALWVTRV